MSDQRSGGKAARIRRILSAQSLRTAELPQSGPFKSTEWPVLPVPPYDAVAVETLERDGEREHLLGFDLDAYEQRVERERKGFIKTLRDRGIGTLQNERTAIEDEIEAVRAACEDAAEEAEAILSDVDEQHRAILQAAVSSGLPFTGPQNDAKQRLAEISRQQQQRIADLFALRFRLDVLRCVYARHVRGLDNDRDAWESLYDALRADPDALVDSYAAHGMPEDIEPLLGDVESRRRFILRQLLPKEKPIPPRYRKHGGLKRLAEDVKTRAEDRYSFKEHKSATLTQYFRRHTSDEEKRIEELRAWTHASQ